MTVARLKVRTAVSPREREMPRPNIRARAVRLKDPAAEPPRERAQPAGTAAAGRTVSAASRYGLDAFAFFVANLQTGFGPFLAVYFSQAKWTQSDIGFALTVGSLVALLGQVPGGAFVDVVRSKRFAAAVAVTGTSSGSMGPTMAPGGSVGLGGKF